MELFNILGINPKDAYVDGEKPQVKETYKEVRETEKSNWSRPGHTIQKNVQATEKGKEARKAIKEDH